MQFDILNKTNSMQSLKVIVEKGESLPLHDHPKTQVFMYILSGKLKVEFYRYKDNDPKTKIIELVSSREMGPGAHGQITERGVNLHCITALEPSVFLDVMTPGYFENTDIKPTWFESYVDKDQIKVLEVPEPLHITQAKEVALQAFEET